MVAQKIIGDIKTGTPYRDLFLEDNFSDNFPISPKPVLDGKNLETEVQRTRDEPDKEVGFKVSIRVSPPHKRSASPQHNEIIDRDTFKHSIANSIRTAPNMTRYTARTELIPKVIPAEYNFEEYAHLLQQSKKPEKVVFYDNLEFFYALNKAKHEFNKTYQSEFIRNYNKNAEDYRSRRDELEGAISGHD